jgi:hypothetical protein
MNINRGGISISHRTRRRVPGWSLTALAMLLSGCGGGGDSSATPPPPPPTPPPAAPSLVMNIALKQLHFSWPSVTGATSYRLFANAGGASGFTQVGPDLASTVTSHHVDVPVHFHDWVNARFRLEACNAGGCTGSNEATTTQSSALEAIGYFKSSNHEAGDNTFSVAISADGARMAIGLPGEDSAASGIGGDQDDNSLNRAGAVVMYQRVDGEWSQESYIKASNPDASDSFGSSVALSADGNTLAVGASGESSNAVGIDGNQSNNTAASSGAAYIFVRDASGVWSQQAYIKASNTQASDFFGRSLALSEDGGTLAVGAQFESSDANGVNGDEGDNSASGAGAAYVFFREANASWTQQAYLKAASSDAGDLFGIAIALSNDGDLLAVGAHADDSAATGIGGDYQDNSLANSGAVYIFIRRLGVWQTSAYIKAPNSAAADYFGRALSLSGDGTVLAVGTTQEDSGATGVGGDQSNDAAQDSGAVYVYTQSSLIWSFQAYLKSSNSEAGDGFGNEVRLSADGNVLAVQAWLERSGATGINGNQLDNTAVETGAVYVFRRESPIAPWVQRAYVKAPNAESGDRFGSALALSADGMTLAATTSSEDSNATGIGGNQDDNSASGAGAAYVY